MQIDHDPEEPKVDRTPLPWKSAIVVLALGWAGYLYSFPTDFISIGLGMLTGVVFTALVIEITGNKTPASWRGKSSRSR